MHTLVFTAVKIINGSHMLVHSIVCMKFLRFFDVVVVVTCSFSVCVWGLASIRFYVADCLEFRFFFLVYV